MARPPSSTLFPYTTLFRSQVAGVQADRAEIGPGHLDRGLHGLGDVVGVDQQRRVAAERVHLHAERDRKSTHLNSSHANISYAVFCLKKKTSKRAHRLPCRH